MVESKLKMLHCLISWQEGADADVKKGSLSSVQQLGIEMTVRYGKYLNLLKEHAENELCFVLMNCEQFLKQQQRTVVSSLRILSQQLFTRNDCIGLLIMVHLPITTVESGIHPVYFCSAHYIEMLLKAELPLVFSAFHMSGFAPSQVNDEITRHLQQDILKHTEAQDLQVFLKEEALHGFRVSDYLEYMESLELMYRPVLLKDMKNIRVQNT
ncbi:UNVERIFIED_CONTAM: hypothetical protein H355_006473 [Colinus virginianus]|nr:hypothetical protein H355_006473 [Colinus virginianus]